MLKGRANGIFFLILLLILDSASSRGNEVEEDTIKSITAIRVNSSVKIDGILDEEVWQKTPRSGDFIQYEPDFGNPATESTFVKVAYDDEALYVGIEMYDSEPEKIKSRLTRRDRMAETDLVNLIIDSYHDHQTAYAFVAYVSGTQRDVYYYNDDWSDDSWNAVWDVATKINRWGWVAEFKVPFYCLRFSSEESPVWGIYFSRRISRKDELDRWVFIPEKASGFVSHFGHLKGLKNLTPPKRLEVLPYLVSYEETEPKSPGNPDGRDFFGNSGVDIKYGITSDITLDATINPDFGQVEQDETILNLSTYETWYPEKRPFFLEGFKIFETPYTLFYSRRIGKSPSIWLHDVDYYINRPAATTILAAAKVSGKTGKGTSIGILEAVTQKEIAEYMHEDGYKTEDVIESEANYFVGRLMQDFWRNSKVGIMATAVNQKGSYPAYTEGLDWDIRFHNGDYSSRGHLMGSKTGPETDGWGIWMRWGKEGGEHIRGAIGGEYLSKGLNFNHMGFLNRDNYKEIWGWLQYKTTKRLWIMGRSWNNLNVEIEDNISGVKLTRAVIFENNIEMVNNWNGGIGFWLDFDNIYDDRETRGGPPVPVPIGRAWWLWFETDSRKWWQINPSISIGDYLDGFSRSFNLWLNFHPKSNIEFSGGPGYLHRDGVSSWLTDFVDVNGERVYIFGEEKVESFDFTLRGTFTFTRDLTLQVYAQPFIAAVDYSNFKKFVPPERYEYVDSTVYNESEKQPDFKWTSFNSNVVLRWEYKPGSTLFLVWTQSRGTWNSGVGDFRLRRDWDNLFDTVPNNTFLIKLNYWWSL